MFDPVEAAFNDVPCVVGDRVERGWAAAAGAAVFAVPGLVGWLGDQGGDAAGSLMPSDRS